MWVGSEDDWVAAIDKKKKKRGTFVAFPPLPPPPSVETKRNPAVLHYGTTCPEKKVSFSSLPLCMHANSICIIFGKTQRAKPTSFLFWTLLCPPPKSGLGHSFRESADDLFYLHTS